MTTNKTEVHGGVGFFGLLTITFIVLKLCNVITWSWFWVLSPNHNTSDYSTYTLFWLYSNIKI